MINFVEVKPKKLFNIQRDGSRINVLKLKTSTITNKFEIITRFVESLSEYFGKDFDDWFENFIVSYSNREHNRFQIISENIEKIKSYVNKYVDSLNIDFSKFVDESKTKTKKSVVFSAEDIEILVKLSGYLKIYSIISNSEVICLENKLHKIIYNMFVSDISIDVITRVFEVIRTKTYRYKLTDRFMWDYVKTIQCRPIQYHVTNIFNFIMNNIIVLCETDKNPITFFVTVTDEAVRWILRSVYKETVVYTDSITLEDIQTSGSTNNLKSLCYNDTIGRLKRAALDRMFEVFGDKEEEVSLHNRLQALRYISPICNCVVFPILSKVTGVPYEHISSMSPEHAAELSVYTYYLVTSVFEDEYANLFNLLQYAPIEPVPTASTFKIRNIFEWSDIQQEIGNFFGYKCLTIPGKLLSFFLGKFSRLKLVNIMSGKELISIPMQKLEADAIQFFPRFFAGHFDDKFKQIRKLIYKDL
jgi:hypothetical protein